MICGRVIDHLANSFKQGGGGKFSNSSSVWGGPNCTKFGENRAPSLLQEWTYFGIDMLLHSEMMSAHRRVVSKINQISHFLTPPP